MDKPTSSIVFNLMSFSFKLRDFLLPRENILQEAGIEPGFVVLDYGCGPGSYTFVAAGTVGESGKVYALDFHPLAIRRVKHIIAKRGLVNVATIYSDCGTGLPDQSIDVVLLYDVFHELSQPEQVLTLGSASDSIRIPGCTQSAALAGKSGTVGEWCRRSESNRYGVAPGGF